MTEEKTTPFPKEAGRSAAAPDPAEGTGGRVATASAEPARRPRSTAPSSARDERLANERAQRALVSLLSDQSTTVYEHARAAALCRGPQLLPFLDEAAESEDALLRVRSRSLREELSTRLLVQELSECRRRLAHDPHALEEAALLLCRARDPQADVRGVTATLDAYARELEQRLQGRHSPRSLLQAIGGYFGGELGYRGNERDYYDVANSYLDRVLDRRIGLPIALSCLVLFVGRRLELPLQGIGLPGHFLLRFGAAQPAWFLDPFHSCRLLSEIDCQELVEASNVSFQASFLQPMSDLRILLRMIGNLQLVYRNREEHYYLRRFDQLRQVLLREPASAGESSDPGQGCRSDP